MPSNSYTDRAASASRNDDNLPPLGAAPDRAAPDRATVAGRRRFRVLVVEDDAIAAMDLEETLEKLGYAVCGLAATASQAVRTAEAERPDLVLMDIRLADGSNGIDAAAEIRERLGIPSLSVTAHDDPATLRRADAARPLGYVRKPYSDADIYTALRRALQMPDA
jgi:two-component system, response regulator PdtaR